MVSLCDEWPSTGAETGCKVGVGVWESGSTVCWHAALFARDSVTLGRASQVVKGPFFFFLFICCTCLREQQQHHCTRKYNAR